MAAVRDLRRHRQCRAYSYKAEDSAGVDTTAAHERNRTSADRSTNRYLKRNCHGNRAPYYPTLDDRQRDPLPASWLFEARIRLRRARRSRAYANEDRNWIPRPDPFSRYRAGFEIRSYRRCRRVLMFHHFPGVPGVGVDCLVRRPISPTPTSRRRSKRTRLATHYCARLRAPGTCVTAQRTARSRCRRWS